MPEYVLNRDYVLRTINGVVSFEKGQPTWVTPQMEKDAVLIGAQRLDGEQIEVLEDEPAKPEAPGGEDRSEQIRTAFSLIVEKNDSKDFTAQGVPKVRAVAAIVGFEVESGEVAELWSEFKIALSEQK